MSSTCTESPEQKKAKVDTNGTEEKPVTEKQDEDFKFSAEPTLEQM